MAHTRILSSNFIETIHEKQRNYLVCLEEIAYENRKIKSHKKN